jgi:hypothetical protein
MHRKIAVIIVFAIACAGFGAWFLFSQQKSYANITSYETCGAAGFPILETYPEQCKTPDGRTFVRDITTDVSNLIQVDAPKPDNIITDGHPLTITGKARGSWYFEGSFPVKLLDASGSVIAQSPAQAEGNWMTEDFVPFKATLNFDLPGSWTGTLLIQNDNPSGLPQNTKEIRIPIRFGRSKPSSTPTLHQAITLQVGEKTTLQNGLVLTLKEINDSRCKPNVQCIWAGEISTLLGGRFNGSTADIRLGTVNNKNATWNGFVFALQNATTDNVTIVVSAMPVTGELRGTILVGPTCPVERIPPDPNCADKPFQNAKVVLKNKVSGAIAQQLLSDSVGNFSAVLSPGTYTIDTSSASGNLLPRCETKDVTVSAGTITNTDISCDSGIR